MHRRSRWSGLGDSDRRDRRLDWLWGACQDRGETSDQQQEQAAPQHQPTGPPAYTPGDRVSVLATFGAGSGAASTHVVARGLEVLSVGEVAANADPSTAAVPVTLAVAKTSEVSSLALANQDAKIDLLLEGQNGSTAAIPSASQGSMP